MAGNELGTEVMEVIRKDNASSPFLNICASRQVSLTSWYQATHPPAKDSASNARFLNPQTSVACQRDRLNFSALQYCKRII